MHETLLLCLGLLITVCLLIILSQRLRLPYPILLVLGGLAVSFVPGLPPIRINPELIFLIFLPPLLYEAAWFTSWKDFWRWRRVISFLAFGLVFLTSGIVAYVSWAIIPGFTLALGFLLGGVVSPPDAVAATSVMRSMSLPRRIMAILEGESLVNDASSLIVFRFALAAVLSGSFVWYEAAGQFVLVTVLGVAVGLGIALVFYALHRWLSVTPSLHTVLTLITPYLLYTTAEAVHASGVMAVVSGGLFLSYQSATIFTPANRRQGLHTWATVGFILNGAVFMLIGLQLPLIVKGLDAYSKLEAIGYGLLISFVVIATRLVLTLLGSPFTHWISRYITVSDANPGWRGPVIVGYAGMRGVVSLAAALSIPLLDSAGQPFPERNMVLFITFIVILVTLVGQGLTLPMLIRWIGVEDLDHLQPEYEQQRAVRGQLITHALDTLNEQYAAQTQRNSLVGALKQKLEKEVHLSTHQVPAGEDDEQEVAEYYHIYSELIGVQRQTLLKLRSQEEYDDEVIRKLETQLDLEEEKLELLMEAQEQTPSAAEHPVAQVTQEEV
ncbi:Na+/H+ antiporter [Hymenobacter sp. GOD-10R]|uniref:Na+/H+ antiporter n=1 Tax=Hymenobacter sp. GOD-10R TaxID=3093922 RepID=UPI002D79014C|nr:Na+/H+ antiporter [Hymenobacter sp. GOD-10R]WRQ28363.1 Na+/H+ antiporter [Hymenobacter sp. GOD-10R]